VVLHFLGTLLAHQATRGFSKLAIRGLGLADAGSVAPHQHRAGLPVDEVEWNISGTWDVSGE
jgi:hypothetical protein